MSIWRQNKECRKPVVCRTAEYIQINMLILPEIPLDMSVCDGSDHEHVAIKQEPIDYEEVKSEEFPPASDSDEDVHGMLSDSLHTIVDPQLRNITEHGKM